MTERDLEIQDLRRELAEKSKIIQEQGTYIAEKLVPEREAKLRAELKQVKNGATGGMSMERLTERHYLGSDYYMKCSEECNVDMDCIDCPALEKLVDRLGAYEDTGLEPEEVSEILIDKAVVETNLKQYEDACGDISISHLRELARADMEGRCVVLPCKVGDTVWVTCAYGTTFDKPKEASVTKFVLHDDEIMFLEAIIFVDLGEGKKDYGFSTTSFGKIVFLTREEAEAGLEAQICTT